MSPDQPLELRQALLGYANRVPEQSRPKHLDADPGRDRKHHDDDRSGSQRDNSSGSEDEDCKASENARENGHREVIPTPL